MLETLYLHATATDAERLLLCLESHLQWLHAHPRAACRWWLCSSPSPALS